MPAAVLRSVTYGDTSSDWKIAPRHHRLSQLCEAFFPIIDAVGQGGPAGGLHECLAGTQPALGEGFDDSSPRTRELPLSAHLQIPLGSMVQIRNLI
jgi:hypothetical protein